MYIHIPFCRRRCGYCDFNTFAGLSHLIPAYVKTLCEEIHYTAEQFSNDESIHTIFFGGGTPSLLSAVQIQDILDCIRSEFIVTSDVEVTMEANPGTVSLDSIIGYAKAGVNRLSFGMQSASKEDLQLLDRQHQFFDVLNAVKYCSESGINRVNLDLIFGIPGQTLDRWKWTLQMALNTGVEHFSLYSLIVEEETPLFRWVEKGLVQSPDEDLEAEMYEAADEMLSAKGYSQYEISNWSKGEDARCRHNLQYWRYEPFFGFGAGATGFINGKRYENFGNVSGYINSIKEFDQSPSKRFPGAETVTRLSLWDQMQERLMVGLRLTGEGISYKNFAQRYGVNVEEVFPDQIALLTREGLIERTDGVDAGIRLTRKGRLLGNQVFMQFVGNSKPTFLGENEDQ